MSINNIKRGRGIFNLSFIAFDCTNISLDHTAALPRWLSDLKLIWPESSEKILTINKSKSNATTSV